MGGQCLLSKGTKEVTLDTARLPLPATATSSTKYKRNRAPRSDRISHEVDRYNFCDVDDGRRVRATGGRVARRSFDFSDITAAERSFVFCSISTRPLRRQAGGARSVSAAHALVKEGGGKAGLSFSVRLLGYDRWIQVGGGVKRLSQSTPPHHHHHLISF